MARPAAPVHKVPVQSWDKILTQYTAATDADVQFGPATVPLRTVTHVEGTTFSQRTLMRFPGMGGIAGQRAFQPAKYYSGHKKPGALA